MSPGLATDLVQSLDAKMLPTKKSDNVEVCSPYKKKCKSKDKPKRPLSAYNLFFQHERDHLLRGLSSPFGYSHDGNHCTLGRDPSKRANRSKKVRPPPHGKIGFAELARTIGARWKGADKQTREHFAMLAANERQRYRLEMELWKHKSANGGVGRSSDGSSTPSSPSPTMSPVLSSTSSSGLSIATSQPLTPHHVSCSDVSRETNCNSLPNTRKMSTTYSQFPTPGDCFKFQAPHAVPANVSFQRDCGGQAWNVSPPLHASSLYDPVPLLQHRNALPRIQYAQHKLQQQVPMLSLLPPQQEQGCRNSTEAANVFLNKEILNTTTAAPAVAATVPDSKDLLDFLAAVIMD